MSGRHRKFHWRRTDGAGKAGSSERHDYVRRTFAHFQLYLSSLARAMFGKIKWFVRLFPADHDCRACAPLDQPAFAAFGALKERRPSTCMGRTPALPYSATLIQLVKGPTDNGAHGDPQRDWKAHLMSRQNHGITHAPGARRSLSTLRAGDRLPQLGDTRHVKAQIRLNPVKPRNFVAFLLSLGGALPSYQLPGCEIGNSMRLALQRSYHSCK